MAAPKVVSADNSDHPAVVQVVFDQDMKADEALINPNNYFLNHGAYVTAVMPIDERTVKLIAENLFGYSSFIVTVSTNLVSINNEALDSGFSTYTFDTIRQAAPNYALAITAENGRLKTGLQIRQTEEDGDSWYILTESGIDIINKQSLLNTAFLLDGYGSYKAIKVVSGE